MRWLSALGLLVLPVLVAIGCHGDRPKECQVLKQCCAAVQASGAEMDTFRVPCTRKDDDDPVLCRRRLDEVFSHAPSFTDNDACKLPPAQ